jgi:hypothetical protein
MKSKVRWVEVFFFIGDLYNFGCNRHFEQGMLKLEVLSVRRRREERDIDSK